MPLAALLLSGWFRVMVAEQSSIGLAARLARLSASRDIRVVERGIVVKEKKPPRVSQPLLPLATAARLVYARATGRSTDDTKTLNDVAGLIAARTRIFTVNADETARVLPAELIASGHFEDGGATLRLTDPKRGPIGPLAIRNVDLGSVMDEVRKIYRQTGS